MKVIKSTIVIHLYIILMLIAGLPVYAANVTGQVWTGAAAMAPAIESEHPYAPSLNHTYTFTAQSGTKTRLHFEYIDTEAGYDFVTVQDEAGITYARYAGRSLSDIWTPWVPGRTVKIIFNSDYAAQGNGWLVDKYATDDAAFPIEGATISLSPGGRTSTTAADGTYSIQNVPSGSYTAAASLLNTAFSPASVGINVSDIQNGTADFEAFENHVTSVVVAPNPFTPNGSETTTITVGAKASQQGMYARIIGGSIDHHIDLDETSATNYTGTWDGIDHSGSEPRILASGTYSVKVYNESNDLFPLAGSIALNSISSVSSSPSTVYPTTGQNALITVNGGAGLLLELRIINSIGNLVRTLPLTWNSPSYTATWNGKDELGSFQPVGLYSLIVYRADTGTRYAVYGTVNIGLAAGITGQVWTGATAMLPTMESAHPYGPSLNETYTFTAQSGTKTRLHLETVDTEGGYDWVAIQDEAGNSYAQYTGRNLSDIWTPWVPGRTVKIVLHSDGSVQYSGFVVDRYATDDIISPITGATITLSPGGRSAATGIDGTYTLADLNPGTYTATPSLAGWAFSARSTGVTVSDLLGGVIDFEAFEDVISSIGASPNPFAPNGANTTLITASGRPGETGLYARIAGGSTDSRIELIESVTGSYTGVWDGMDHSGIEPQIPASGNFNVRIFNKYTDQLTQSATIVLNSITGVAASPSTFYPTAGQTTTISVNGSAGLNLEVRLVKSDGTVVRTLPLTWSPSNYTATWNGKDELGSYQPAGDYSIRIYRSDTGVRYATTGIVTIGQAAGITGQVWTGATAMLPTIESAHPYGPGLNEAYTFTAPSGIKTRLHLEKVNTEPGYDWVTIQDEAGNTITRYAGWNLSDIWTPWVPGRVVKINFTSDGSVQGSGFVVDRYATDDTISPIEGATITLSPGGRSAITGIDGTYTLADLNPGTYTANPSLAGWEFSSRSISTTVSSTQGGIADFEAFEHVVTSISADPNPFIPNGISTTLITVSGTPGETGLYARVIGGNIDQKIDLTETSAGSYTGAWDGMDRAGVEPKIPVPGDYSVRVYNKNTDMFSALATIALQSVTAVSTSPGTFYATAGQSTNIRVTGSISSLPLEVRIANSGGIIVRTLPLSWSSDAYKAVWDGKDENGDYQPAGPYEVRVYRSDTGARYAASGPVTIGAAASVTGMVWTGATPMLPTMQSANPYGPSLNETSTFTAPSGIKTRLHLETVDTEGGYDWVTIQDEAGNTIARYSGWKLSDIWTPWVPGRVIKIKFTSDGSIQGSGWVVDRYATDDTITGVDNARIAVSSTSKTGNTGVDGIYSIPDLAPESFTFTPSKDAWRFSPASTVAQLAAGQTTVLDYEAWQNWITAVSASPNPFVPSGANTTTISASGISGETGLYTRIFGPVSDQKLALTEGPSGNYSREWDGLDHTFADARILPGGSYTVKIYNSHADPFSAMATITLNSVSAVAASPASFYGTAGQTTAITVSASSGLPLEMRIANEAGIVIRTLPLVWNSGSYSAVWDGKGDGGTGLLAGTYGLRVYRTDTGTRYVTTGSAVILPAAGVKGNVWIGGQALLPVVESAHPYANNDSRIWTIHSSGGTKTRVHFETVNIMGPDDHLYVKDNNGTVIADYRGTYNDLWSPWVTGNTVKVQLVSNATDNGYGFLIDKYITDSSSSAAVGITITINPGNRKTVTGPDGAYSVMDLVPGSYTIAPSGSGWAFDPASTGVSLATGSVTVVDFWAIQEGEVLQSIAQARQRPDGWTVQLPYSVVSATFANCFYIEDADRTAGIRVNTNNPVIENNRARVVGRLSTINGERVITPITVDTENASVAVRALGMTNLTAVGSDLNLYTYGADGASGLNNSGLLVRIYGKVTQDTPAAFYVDDGSGLNNGLGIAVSKTGLYSVRTLPAVAVNDWVTITGIATTQQTANGLERLIRPRTNSDVQIKHFVN